MTVHVSVRSISALLLLSVSLLGLPAEALAQSVVTPQKAAPTLAERLDRLAAEFDRNRIDLHVPGAVLAIVRGEEVIFARGFGVADIGRKTPVTPDTPFLIASATKALTATLVGMLVDEGRMQWDDPLEKYLPEFKLAVRSNDPNDRATLRDVLSHRTGFTRMAFLEINRGLSESMTLRRIPVAAANAILRTTGSVQVDRVEAGAGHLHARAIRRVGSKKVAGHKGILFKMVHAYAFEHADRQDLFQEITIQVWRSVDAFRGDSSVPTWTYRVALNTAIAWTRKEGRHQRGKAPFEVVEGLLTTSSSDGRDPRVEWLYLEIAQLRTSTAPWPCCSSTASATRKSPPSSASPRATWG